MDDGKYIPMNDEQKAMFEYETLHLMDLSMHCVGLNCDGCDGSNRRLVMKPAEGSDQRIGEHKITIEEVGRCQCWCHAERHMAHLRHLNKIGVR